METKNIFQNFAQYIHTSKPLYFVFQLVGVLFAGTIILSIALTQLLAFLLIALAIIVCTKERKYYTTQFDIPLLLFICARIVSIVFAEVREASMLSLYKEVPFYFLFYALSQLFHRASVQYKRIFFIALITGGAIGSVYGILLFSIGSIGRAHSTTSGYYTLGTYLTAMLAYMLVVGHKGLGLQKYYIWLMAVLLYFTGVVLTLNRIHWGITVLLLLIVGLLKYRKLLVGFLIAGVFLYVSSPLVQKRVEHTLYFTSHLSDRDVLWQEGIQHAFVHPFFGYGPNSFYYIFEHMDLLQDKKVSGWHNEYLRLQIESGLVGVITFLVLLITIIVYSIRSIKTGEYEQIQQVVGIDCAIATIVLSSITGSAFFDILILLLWVSLCAFLFTMQDITSKSSDTKEGQMRI